MGQSEKIACFTQKMSKLEYSSILAILMLIGLYIEVFVSSSVGFSLFSILMAVLFLSLMGYSRFFWRWDCFFGNVLTLGLVWLILEPLSGSDGQTGEESLWIAAKLLVKV